MFYCRCVAESGELKPVSYICLNMIATILSITGDTPVEQTQQRFYTRFMSYFGRTD
jgi:hypothetical protein